MKKGAAVAGRGDPATAAPRPHEVSLRGNDEEGDRGKG